MKYMVKKIIIGVAIGFILMTIKSCKVNAAVQYLSDGWSWAINGKWDVCQKSGSDFLCTDGFEKSWGETSSRTLLYGDSAGLWSENYFFLKELSFHVEYGSSSVYLNSNFQLLNSMPFFYNHNREGFENINLNRSWSYVKFTTSDNTICEVSSDTVGYVIRLTGSPYSGYGFTPAIQVPQACRGKYMKQLDVMYTPSPTYNGPQNTFHAIDYNATDLNDFLQKNQNNQYLDVWHGQEIQTSANFNDAQFYQSSQWYYSNYIFKPTSYSPANLEIQQNMSDLQKQIIMSQMFIGSDEFGSEQNEEFAESFGTIVENMETSTSNTQFTDFLNALVLQPVSLLTQSASSDFYTRSPSFQLTGGLCFDSFQQGGTNRGFIPIPFTHYTNGSNKRFQMPCLTRDVYSHLGYHDNYDSYSIMGDPSLTDYDSTALGYGWGVSFMGIWLVIQHGILYYFLIITFIKIVKYCIDTKDAEIEVMDL